MTYLIKRLGLSTICMVLSLCAIAQPTFTFDSKSANTGEVVTIDCRVDNFEDLIGVSFSVQYDSMIIKLESIDNITTSLAGIVFAAPPDIKQGRVTLGWFNQSSPTTIANGSLFFTMSFRVVGAVGTSSSVCINQDRLVEAVQVIDGMDTNIGINEVKGSVQVLGGGTPDPLLRVGTRTSDPGTRVCVPVTVQDFNEVRGLEYGLTWDPSVLRFDAIESLNLTDLDMSDFNTTNAASGSLTKVWTTAMPDGITLANNTAIYEVCYDIVGAAGSSSTIEFENVLGSPTVITANGRVNVSGVMTEGLAFIIEDAVGPQGGVQCVDVTVNDFVDVTSFQYSMMYDPTEAEFLEFRNILPAFAPVMILGSEDDGLQPGQLSAAWFELSGSTLENGTVLYSVCFQDVNLECEDSYILKFSDMPTPVVISNRSQGQLDPSQYTLVDGSVTISCGVDLVVDAVTNVDCNGESTGAIFTTISPPGDYTVTLNGENSVEDPSGLPANTYVIVVTDNTDPTNSATQTVNVTENPPIVISGDVTAASAGMDNGEINNLNITGGAGGYTCTWDNALLTDCNGGMNLPCGDYTITVTDASDCTESMTFSIGCGEVQLVVVDMLDKSCNIQDDENCDGLIEVSASGVGPFTYTINGESFDGLADDLCAGDYTIVVTDTGDDNKTASQVISIDQPDQLEIFIEKEDPSEIGMADGAVYVTGVVGGTAPYNITIGEMETDTLEGLMTGRYEVIVVDAAGCSVSRSVDIGIDPEDCYKGRPAITPNGDGFNNFLTINCLGIPLENELRIFNRWGQLVFRAQNYDETWAGEDFRGQALPEDVYFWVLSLTLPDNMQREVTGYVNLIRDLK